MRDRNRQSRRTESGCRGLHSQGKMADGRWQMANPDKRRRDVAGSIVDSRLGVFQDVVELAGDFDKPLAPVLRRVERGFDAECLSKEIGEILEIGFFDGAGFQAEREGIWVCG